MKKKDHLELYRQMVLIRRVEERAAELYQEGKIGGFLHLYIGQEAVSTGIVSARIPEDRVITAYRDHGVAINCGISAKQVLAELLGKETGISKGRGGSMHMASVENNYWGGHAIVGAHLPIASGMALGDQYLGNKGVTICMFGDGATNIGFFHEGVNLSKVWNLPVLWICENNQYGMGTAVDRASAVEEIHMKAEGYGIPHSRLDDGMDVMKVRAKVAEALDFIRAGNGPYFLEIMTYRFEGHSMGDPQRYRDKEEVTQWEKTDPIGIYHRYLVDEKIASKADLDKIEAAVETETQEAVEFAESSPDPAMDTLFDFVYAEGN
ncbi:MAG: pyruvate dehydrogenase (acetyl-transferring) E1 component subunit alpha [Anaerolineales bacterium]|nr:pyruvate dehydrogenase (acetyl-transferring) E1 component subunit alpha [Anaerolineales bacterium]MCW5855752.1 pyruvate dehydrogenase (acetyl-transferring) E1 component subunit alpha [Anaerolineales bacterium]